MATTKEAEASNSGETNPVLGKLGKSGTGKGWSKVRSHVLSKRSAKEETIQKWQTITKSLKHGVVDFFGVSKEGEKGLSEKWRSRTKQLYASNILFGHLKPTSGGTDGEVADSPLPPYEAEMNLLATGEGYDLPDSASRTCPVPKRSQRAELVHPRSKEDVWTLMWMAIQHKKDEIIAPRNRSFAPSCQQRQKSDVMGSIFLMSEVQFFDEPIATSAKSEIPKPLPESKEQEQGDVTDFGLGFVLAAWKPVKSGEVEEGTELKKSARIGNKILDEVFDNTDRKAGVGLAGRILGWKQDRSKLDKDALKKLDKMDDTSHRPYFTYWVTFVQIICYLIAVSVYGIAPFGFEETDVTGEVLTSGLFVEIVHYQEKDNFWIGPRQADLIHLGAKYSPCMRKDTNVEEAILRDRKKENMTACCIRNDGSGCVQTPQSTCSATLSTWYKWKNETRESGSVCGQDPHYCKAPASVVPYEWPDEIIKWPICTTKTSISEGAPKHMTCDIDGRPCCIGIQGECKIMTREHCTFVRGYFHEEATLCAQISCMSETCGMFPFYNPDVPNQFYRLWTSLFIHAGLLQLLISVLFQVFIMRDVEKFLGWIRISIIYISSGIAGSLASAIFIPYHVEAGPSGSQFGIFACLFVEAIHYWQTVGKPSRVLAKLGGILLALFIVGLLPMIDNYAHLFGFIFGFFVSFSLMPHVNFNIKDKQRKIIAICVCLFGSLGMFALLVVLFYVTPINSCRYCEFFNCIPFTDTFCRSMEVKIRRADEY